MEGNSRLLTCKIWRLETLWSDEQISPQLDFFGIFRNCDLVFGGFGLPLRLSRLFLGLGQIIEASVISAESSKASTDGGGESECANHKSDTAYEILSAPILRFPSLVLVFTGIPMLASEIFYLKWCVALTATPLIIIGGICAELSWLLPPEHDHAHYCESEYQT